MEKNTTLSAACFALIFSLPFPIWCSGEDEKRSPIYPFDVTLAGQEAQIEGSQQYAIFAKIPKPVPNDAEMVLNAEAETIFVNIFRCNEKGEVSRADGGKAKIIMAPDANRVKLNATMDKTVLEDGLYLMNVVLSSKGTSRIMFRVGDKEEKRGAVVDQSKPEAVVTAIFTAAKSGDFSALKALLPPSGKNDGDVTQVCTVGEASEKAVKSFRSFFEKGKISGKARISSDGSKAEVDFLFGPDGTKEETMNLLKENGKWYLGSF